MNKLCIQVLFLLGTSAISYAQPGTLDQSFGSLGKVTTAIGPNNASASAIAFQPDGKILLAGKSFTDNTLLDDFALARYNPDGSLDNSFGTNGLVITDLQQAVDVATAITLQPDGKIVVAGHTHNGNNYDFAVARYLSNGDLDNTFGTNGKVLKNFGSTDFGLAMALLPNGKIVVAGRAYNGQNSDFAMVQLNSNGSFDNSFGTSGAVMANLFAEVESANAIAIQADGKIVLAGDRYANNTSLFALARFNTDGSLDPSFGLNGKVSTSIVGLSDVAYAVAVQSNGSIVAAGVSNNTSISDFAVARYLSDGTPDNSFDGDGQLTTNVTNGGDYASTIAIQADGKILVGGTALGSNSISDFAVVRYLPDGGQDGSFGTNGISQLDFNNGTDVANSMAMHQGKLVVAGYTDKDAKSSFALARLNVGSSVGASDLYAKDSPHIFPNPAVEMVQISVPAAAVEGKCQVFSSTGHLVTEFSSIPPIMKINVSSWACGVYIIKFCDNEGLCTVAKLRVMRY